MSPHRLRAKRTDSLACSCTCSGVIRSFFSMCSAEVAMKVWMRARAAGFSASAALELARDAHLLVLGHGRARRLLAVAQRGVEDDQLVCHADSLLFVASPARC